jgi:hypothetical protein
MKHSKMLTLELLKELIIEVLQEKRLEKDHCNDLNVKEKMICHAKDDKSRERSNLKRKKRQALFPAFDEFKALGKGILSEEEPMTNNLKPKLRKFIKNLNRDEIEEFRKIIKKPTTDDLLNFCDKLQSASRGNLDDDRRKELELKLKAKKQNDKS